MLKAKNVQSLANCIRFLECSQTTHGQSRAKNSILSVSASSFMTNLVSLFLGPGPKSSCYDIFLTAACKETSSSKEILTKLNCLSARYYWLKYSNNAYFIQGCILDSSCSHPGPTCKCPAASASFWTHSMQTAVHHRYETGPWFPSNNKLVSHSFGYSLVSLQLFQTLLPREFH